MTARNRKPKPPPRCAGCGAAFWRLCKPTCPAPAPNRPHQLILFDAPEMTVHCCWCEFRQPWLGDEHATHAAMEFHYGTVHKALLDRLCGVAS